MDERPKHVCAPVKETLGVILFTAIFINVVLVILIMVGITCKFFRIFQKTFKNSFIFIITYYFVVGRHS